MMTCVVMIGWWGLCGGYNGECCDFGWLGCDFVFVFDCFLGGFEIWVGWLVVVLVFECLNYFVVFLEL